MARGVEGRMRKYWSKAVVPKLFGTRDRFHGRQFFHGCGWRGYGSGGNASIGEQRGAADEASFARPPLTSSSTDRYWSAARGLGTPGLRVQSFRINEFWRFDVQHGDFVLEIC